MMRAVWSFWSKPYRIQRNNVWLSDRHHLFSWVLSVETARQHYPDTTLVTDDSGAKLLVDQLGLPFTHVSTQLNDLSNHAPGWWALGKLFAYRLQKDAFVHIDNDVFLWKRLPEHLEKATVFTQNPEYFPAQNWAYKPKEFELEIKKHNGGWLPREWEWYRAAVTEQRGECCGILGGLRVDFIQFYADLAIRLIEDPSNHTASARLSDNAANMLLPEQYLLAACIEFHKGCEWSPYKDVNMRYLFASAEDAWIPEKSASVGFTHLISDTKINRAVMDRLEKRIKKDYPRYYERCVELTPNYQTELCA